MTDELVTLRTAADVTEEVIAAAVDCAEAAHNLGNSNQTDWERAYDHLETQYGYFVKDLGSPADRKIRREVRKRAGEELT